MGTVFDGFIGYTKGVGLKDCFFALGVRGASLAAVSGIACMCIWQFAHMHMGGACVAGLRSGVGFLRRGKPVDPRSHAKGREELLFVRGGARRNGKGIFSVLAGSRSLSARTFHFLAGFAN